MDTMKIILDEMDLNDLIVAVRAAKSAIRDGRPRGSPAYQVWSYEDGSNYVTVWNKKSIRVFKSGMYD